MKGNIIIMDSANKDKTLNVQASFPDYVFPDLSNGKDVDIDVHWGQTLRLQVNAPGHPFRINNVGSDSITNNGAQSGTIVFDTSKVNPGTYTYVCIYHSQMTGKINVVAPPDCF